LGPDTGSDNGLAMATFRDVNDARKVSRNHKNTSISATCVTVSDWARPCVCLR